MYLLYGRVYRALIYLGGGSYKHLKRKTPEKGINRQEFIEHLVEEYYTTTNVESQEQVTANLANFAYDPINWYYLKSSEVLKLFVELLATPNEKLQLHGTAGLCNICLDNQAYSFIVKTQNIKIIKDLLLKTENLNVILNTLTLLFQLLADSQSNKTNILCATILKKIKHFKTLYESDQRIVNISSLLLEEFGKRYVLVEVNTISLPNGKMFE